MGEISIVEGKKLNILLVSTFYYPRGGAPVYVIKLEQLLCDVGHNPIIFSMKSPQNLPSQYEEYFVGHIEFSQLVNNATVKNVWKVINRVFHFRQARENMERLLSENRVDVVHLNNFLHHITLSIIEPIRRRNIPIIWTLHDHILVCPNTNLFDDRRSEPCDACRSTLARFFNPIFRRCKKGSLGASFLAGLEALYIAAHKPAQIPEIFISPSRFLMEQHRRMGFDVSRFVVLPNFVEVDQFEPRPGGDYVFYFGRLSPEKGVDTLIRACAKVRVPLVIAGDGPARENLERLAEKTGAQAKFLGFLTGDDLKEALYGARFTVLPSTCFENAPLSILESFAAGKPVIGSNLGGIPELINDDTGILFPPGDVDSLADAILSLWNSPEKTKKMGFSARKFVEGNFTPEKHIANLLELYRKVLKSV
ncbi:glycosyltransferase family 4 protein [bacterium]|nr:glycosyltransferase family 4 protein [bacterium]